MQSHWGTELGGSRASGGLLSPGGGRIQLGAALRSPAAAGPGGAGDPLGGCEEEEEKGGGEGGGCEEPPGVAAARPPRSLLRGNGEGKWLERTRPCWGQPLGSAVPGGEDAAGAVRGSPWRGRAGGGRQPPSRTCSRRQELKEFAK